MILCSRQVKPSPKRRPIDFQSFWTTLGEVAGSAVFSGSDHLGVDEMIKISKKTIAYLTRRRWAYLWGQKSMIEPVFIPQALGNGDKLLAVTPLNTRPNYYLIRVDSSWSDFNTDEPCVGDHIDEICDVIEDYVGPKHFEDDDGNEVSEPWPYLDDECGVSWCDSMDLIGRKRAA